LCKNRAGTRRRAGREQNQGEAEEDNNRTAGDAVKQARLASGYVGHEKDFLDA